MFNKLRFHYDEWVVKLIVTILFLITLGLMSCLIYLLDLPLKDKLTHLTDYAYWKIRAIRFDGYDKTGLLTPHIRIAGTLRGMNKKGHIVVRYAQNGNFIEASYQLADLKLIDVTKAATLIKAYSQTSVSIDVYSTNTHDVAVIWDMHNKPLNLLLVTQYIAIPIDVPPTNIMNLLMSEHIWRKLW